MSTRDDDFLRRLRETFKVEAGEHLQAIAAGLLELESAGAREAHREMVETVFRAAHSLKGAARAVDMSAIESDCRTLEDVFAAWKREEGAPSRAALDRLHRTLDTIASALGPTATVGSGSPLPAAGAQTAAPVPPSPAGTPGDGVADRGTAVPAAGRGTAEDTVRVAVAKLDTQLLQAEEMLAAKIAVGQRAADLRELAGRFEVWKHEWTALEPEARALRRAQLAPVSGADRVTAERSRLLDFLDWTADSLGALEASAAALGKAAQQDCHVVGKLVDQLLEDSKNLLLLPFATISASFPKLVRDLCRDQGKEAALAIEGEETAIDRRVLEEMKDPLIHLLRNSIDHGIEPPGDRVRSGKTPRATITLAVTQRDGGKVQLLLSDDGAGLDTDKLRQWALEHGHVAADEADRLGDAETQALVFRSGVSTSPMITQLSGRGLGLAIVREKAEKLGGTVEVESRPGLGTTFRIIVPATRATSRGLLVEAAGRLLVVPTAQVERVARARSDNIQTVEGRTTLSLDGHALALVQLADVLELPLAARPDAPPGGAPVVILGSGDGRVAFAVDAVLDEREVLVKPLRPPLARVRNVAAATVLGSGRVAPILDVADLLKSAARSGAAAARPPAAPKPAGAGKILVAEDSITSRMMIKGILEAAGYTATAAVDGMEALTLLRAEPFDLVVSDVEMPRLNGFDLTARIRAEPKLAQLPVVLVTALETREDRERGIDAGASAYLVKSGFDQSDLLEAIRRLI